MFRLIYTSRARMPDDAAARAAEMADIVAVARPANAAVGVTGVLLHTAEGFVQVLEGALPAVTATFERIEADPRHGDVTVLEAGPVAARLFGEWSMTAVEAPAASRLTLAEATADPVTLLALLRHLLGAMA